MQPYDERNIKGDDAIIRRIDPDQHIVLDANLGCERISSKAFRPSSGPQGGMSVDIEKLILDDRIDPREFVTTPRFRASVSFAAKVARGLGLRVGYDPILGNGQIPANPYHGEVWGPDDNPNKFSNGQRNGLHRAVEWYVELPGVEIR